MTPTSWARYTIIAMVEWKSQQGWQNNLALIQQYVCPAMASLLIPEGTIAFVSNLCL